LAQVCKLWHQEISSDCWKLPGRRLHHIELQRHDEKQEARRNDAELADICKKCLMWCRHVREWGWHEWSNVQNINGPFWLERMGTTHKETRTKCKMWWHSQMHHMSTCVAQSMPPTQLTDRTRFCRGMNWKSTYLSVKSQLTWQQAHYNFKEVVVSKIPTSDKVPPNSTLFMNLV
jgi:hypothetical protein